MAKGKFQRWLEPENLLILEGWARDGLIDTEMAQRMGINIGTYYLWQNKFPQFKEAIKKGKEYIDYQVEQALLKNALGFEVEEDVVLNNSTVQKITKYHSPNTTAQIYWLNNRKPKNWSNKSKVDISTSTGVSFTWKKEEEADGEQE